MTVTDIDVVGADQYAVFRVRVRALTPLSPTFLRMTFTGDHLDSFADNGDDQRIKVIFPLVDGSLPDLPPGREWRRAWAALPDHRRNPVRTYTARAVRPEAREIDIDFVLHGDNGPASRWAATAAVGDELLVVGPNSRHDGPHQGVEWEPPPGTDCLLLAGDETALPAISSILERLPADARGVAVLEVPGDADIQRLTAPRGVQLVWCPRRGVSHGKLLERAVRDVAAQLLARSARKPDDLDVDLDIQLDDPDLLWDVPRKHAPDGALVDGGYAWLAGEASCIARLRRYLVRDLGVDRRSASFMGYWRQGTVEEG